MDTAELRARFTRLQRIAEIEYADIVRSTLLLPGKLRITLVDQSFLDVWYSITIPGRYAYHWERRHLDHQLYRYDNIPHRRWNSVSTFPAHYHHGSEDNVQASDLSDDPDHAIRYVLSFIKSKLESS